MADSIIKPKAPVVAGWQRLSPPAEWVTLGFAGERWYHFDTGLAVISAVEVAKDVDGIERGPEYHISISKADPRHPRIGMRCTSQEAAEVLRQFDLDGAEEDNHVPSGIARSFWRPVADRFVGMECACKAEEPAVVEDKGDYVWRGTDHG